MARMNSLTQFLTDVATAIRTKKGSEATIAAEDFDTEILNLPAQGRYQEKSLEITTNGNYRVVPDTGYDAMTSVDVTVLGSSRPTIDIQMEEAELIGSGKQGYENNIYLGGGDISNAITITVLNVYNINFGKIGDFVKKQAIITNKSESLSGMYDFANIVINGEEVRFVPGNGFNILPDGGWFILKVRCTDAYSNVLDTNGLTVSNDPAPWDNIDPEEFE